MHWNDPIQTLKGIGDDAAAAMHKVGIETIRDALLHLPHRYENRAAVDSIAVASMQKDAVCVQGTVVGHLFNPGRRPSLTVTMKDASGFLRVLFYGNFRGIQERTPVGSLVRCYGRIKPGRHGPEMTSAEYIPVVAGEPCDWDHAMRPVYSLSHGVSNGRVCRVIRAALNAMSGLGLPEVLTPYTGMSLVQALEQVHAPDASTSLDELNQRSHPAQTRLILEELVAQQISMRTARHEVKRRFSPVFHGDRNKEQALLANLPFKLTSAQLRVTQEIKQDLAMDHPMLRLLQGDVGSGKTLVAALAALTVIAAGFQVVLMAPTELLAEQHVGTFSQWFSPLGIRVASMSARLSGKKAKETLLTDIRTGQCQLIIGTHSVFQSDVQFAQVGLVIIDEQHRFGVKQRMDLMLKVTTAEGTVPHQLVMTATPIPRTLQMTAFSDLDVSVIDELPPGRTPVKTVVMCENRRSELAVSVLNTIREKKQQVYWVCPLIEESEKRQDQAAETLFLDLHRMLPETKIALVHGRMKSKEKNQVMAAFSQGEIDVLVATTVIEVGVNVPNASLMIIENAERLGLAQLHQLRGRVGRGSAESFCLLLYKAPLSRLQKERLAIMRETNDGFLIAQKDLENRGAGDVLGCQQAGVVKYHIADLSLDDALLAPAQEFCSQLLKSEDGAAQTLCDFWFMEDRVFVRV